MFLGVGPHDPACSVRPWGHGGPGIIIISWRASVIWANSNCRRQSLTRNGITNRRRLERGKDQACQSLCLGISSSWIPAKSYYLWSTIRGIQLPPSRP